MHIEMSEVDYYVNESEQKKDAWYQPFCGVEVISPTRKEVVLRLCREVYYYENFPLWNHALTVYLFPYCRTLINQIVMLPIVGSGKHFDAKVLEHNGKDYLVVDLLNIADYTSSVKEMCYILHNLCHVHLLRYYMSHAYEKPIAYIPQLEYRFFCEGLIQYLSWNEDAAVYRLKEARYIHRKKDAFYTLNKAFEIKEKQFREQILVMLEKLDLWQRFTDVAGMFYCDFLYQSGGKRRLKEYVDAGFEGSVTTLIETISQQSLSMGKK